MPPRSPSAPVVDTRVIAKIIMSAFIMVVGTMSIFLWTIPGSYKALAEMNEASKNATTVGFTTFVMFQLFNAYNCRSLSKSVFSLGLLSNVYLLLSVGAALLTQMAVIYVPFLQLVFKTEALSWPDLLRCIGVASLVFVADEIWKLVAAIVAPAKPLPPPSPDPVRKGN
eukprot:TRINITY_DN3719_c0_g1_i2.p1 TRINITY_DN3719_c0_g1~~TRINITY_DN3719_c0_g1_i2.p1  ORF type:complete len:169 (-),score=36.47 TRINITY_DN3719_c0_g1_i2:82-588(-)